MSSGTERPTYLAARLQELAADLAIKRTVEEVRIGLAYTAVRLDDNSLGVALTFLDDWERCCQGLAEREPLAKRNASDLLPMLASSTPVEAALGLACVNALFNGHVRGQQDGDVLEVVGLQPSDKVVMVGHFRPIVKRLKNRIGSLHIFERKPDASSMVRPADEVFSELPDADIALITATSILNHSLDPILDAAHGCRQVVLLGASTPLVPEAFENSPVTLLSGVVVRNNEAILQTISEGGGMYIFKHYVDKVNISVAGRS